MDLKHVFINKEIDLADYFYAQVVNIEYLDYVYDVDQNEILDTSACNS